MTMSLLDHAKLLAIAPAMPFDKVDRYLSLCQDALAKYSIMTPARITMFLSQYAHESGSFKYLTELADGSAYEGRKDLGNIFPGDGKKYKGRSFGQITGRANYALISKAAGVDFVSHPEQLALEQFAFEGAAWFWDYHSLNAKADAFDLVGTTHVINGGENGLASRCMFFGRGLGAFFGAP